MMDDFEKGYLAKLKAMPDEERRKLFYGEFALDPLPPPQTHEEFIEEQRRKGEQMARRSVFGGRSWGKTCRMNMLRGND